jgi:predicted ribosome quality control (RQC) complex YloA/Tae2 family protein
MALSAAEISNVLHEIAPAVLGGSVQKIFQPHAQAIILEIRKYRESVLLMLSADPDTARIHLLTTRPPNPPAPPDFCQFLRAHVEGGRVVALEQWQGDRIVRLTIAGRERPLLLVGELTGRSANLLLLDEAEKILRVLKLKPHGDRYILPLGGPWIATGSQDERNPQTRAFPISAEMEHRYGQQEAEREQTRLQRARLAEVRKAIKKTTRRLESLMGDLNKATRYRDYARYGELLKTHLGDIAKGQDRATVVDYFEPALSELVLPLDPAKDAHGNMEDYFRKYRKYLVAEREIRPRIEAAEGALITLRSELEKLERGEWHPPLHGDASVTASRSASRPSATVRQKTPRAPFRRFISVDGLPIFVGRNARENEQLTFGFARSHDLWFHARAVPGSHVVLRIDKGVTPPIESMRDAGTLALLYSDLKKSRRGDVIYARRSDVRKIKGKSPGTVTVTQDKTLLVDLDQARLRRLKESSGPSEKTVH